MTDRMNPAVKTEWLKALRSGEYPQTRGKLHRMQGHPTDVDKPVGWCCYGVLCDVAVKNGVPVVRKADDTTEWFDGDCAYLPISVVEWAGLSDVSPELRGYSLAERNDNGATFEEIADLIEEDL